MTDQTIDSFFSVGGSKGLSFPTPGTSYTGTITAVHPPEPVRDPKTNLPTEKMQVRIELDTDLRDPDNPDDEGKRTLYVKSYMRGAIADAIKKAGAKAPEVGAKLTVEFTHEGEKTSPGLSAPKMFSAEYVSPGGAFLTNGSGASAGPSRPDSITPAAWDQMDAATRQAVANTVGAAAPPF